MPSELRLILSEFEEATASLTKLEHLRCDCLLFWQRYFWVPPPNVKTLFITCFVQPSWWERFAKSTFGSTRSHLVNICHIAVFAFLSFYGTRSNKVPCLFLFVSAFRITSSTIFPDPRLHRTDTSHR